MIPSLGENTPDSWLTALTLGVISCAAIAVTIALCTRTNGNPDDDEYDL